jgi:hypothetical protein
MTGVGKYLYRFLTTNKHNIFLLQAYIHTSKHTLSLVTKRERKERRNTVGM